MALASQAFALRLAAQNSFMRSDWALRASLDMPLRCRRGFVCGTADATVDFGGRPRCLGFDSASHFDAQGPLFNETLGEPLFSVEPGDVEFEVTPLDLMRRLPRISGARADCQAASAGDLEHREPEAGLRFLPPGEGTQSGARSRYTGGPQQTAKSAEAPQVTASVTLMRSSRASAWISVRGCNLELIEHFPLPPPVLLHCRVAERNDSLFQFNSVFTQVSE